MSNKIAFIVCVNNELYFDECSYYINRLAPPDGIEAEIIGIRDAASMCAAYNLGMQSTDAKYKVYMHQDVFIREKDFIKYVLSVFQLNPAVGMIGVVGGVGMPKTGTTYLAWNVGIVDCREPDMAYHLVCDPEGDKDKYVDAVDGLLMVTQYDIPWREDLFRNFDFYDISQSFEMRRHGYKIMVPYQQNPWVIHDSSFAKLNHYDDNRKICLKEYPEYFTEDDGFPFIYQEEWETLSDELAAEVKGLIDNGNWDDVKNVIEVYRENRMKNSKLEMYGIMSDIYQKEKQVHADRGFFYGLSDYEEIYQKYVKVRFLLRRMETGMPEDEYMELLEALKKREISCEAVIVMVLHAVLDKKVVLRKIENCYRQEGEVLSAEKIHAFYEKIKDKDIPRALSKRAKEK